MANDIDVILSVGKGGVSDGVIAQADEALTAHELIKGSVQTNADLSARDVCGLIVEATGAEPVQCIGRKFVLFRPSKDKKINLPG